MGAWAGHRVKIPAAIQVSPEALLGGGIAKIQDGDMLLLDAKNGILQVLIEDKEWEARKPSTPFMRELFGSGRELFAGLAFFSWQHRDGRSELWRVAMQSLDILNAGRIIPVMVVEEAQNAVPLVGLWCRGH